MSYVRAYNAWLPGLDTPAKGAPKAPKGVLLSASGSPYELAKSPNIVLREVPGRPGVRENEFLRDENGTISYKPQAEIDQVAKLRKQQIEMAVGSRLRTKNDPTLGRREIQNPRTGKVEREISGSRLPDNIGALQHFGPWILSLLGTFDSNKGLGNIYSSKYNRVGTGESGTYKVLKMGGIRSEVFDHSEPFNYSVTREGHIQAHVIDITNLRKKVIQGINREAFAAHNNDPVAIRDSVDQLVKNFKANLPSENGIGSAKLREINALLFTGSKVHRDANPLAADYGPQGMVRRLRMDRIEDTRAVSPSEQSSRQADGAGSIPKDGFYFDLDAYHRVNENRMPDLLPGYTGHGIDYLATRNPVEESAAIQQRGGEEHKKAINAAISVLQGGPDGSFIRPDIGVVHVMKGSDGTHERGFEDASGIDGIITKRILRNEDPAEAVAGAITAAAIGKQIQARGGPLGRIEAEHNGYRAILSLAHTGKPKSWVLTGYRRDDGAARESNNPSRYAPQGSGGRRAVVASSVVKLIRELESVK